MFPFANGYSSARGFMRPGAPVSDWDNYAFTTSIIQPIGSSRVTAAQPLRLVNSSSRGPSAVPTRSRGKIWSFTAYTQDVCDSFQSLNSGALRFLAILISSKPDSHGIHLGYLHLDDKKDEKIIVNALEKARFKSVQINGRGSIDTEVWKVSAIKSILARDDTRPLPYLYNKLGPEMDALIGDAQAALDLERGISHTSGGVPRRASREDMLAQRLQRWADTRQLPMMWTRRNRVNPEADRVQCGAFRADFTYELDDQRVVLLEHDENAHRSYALDREIKRQPQMALGFGARPVTFIRYNPDGEASEEERLALLLQRLQAAMAPAPADDSHFKHFLTVEYLFYPRIEGGGNSGAVQTFHFKTVGAYERWAVLRMTGMPLLGDSSNDDDDDIRNDGAASSSAARYEQEEVAHDAMEVDAPPLAADIDAFVPLLGSPSHADILRALVAAGPDHQAMALAVGALFRPSLQAAVAAVDGAGTALGESQARVLQARDQTASLRTYTQQVAQDIHVELGCVMEVLCDHMAELLY